MLTLIVTDCCENFTVLNVCSNWPEAEIAVQACLGEGESAEETVFATDARECERNVLVAAEKYLLDVIDRQSQPNASMINRDAAEHLANVRAALN